MKAKRTWVVLLVVVLAAAMLLSACEPKATPSPSTSVAPSVSTGTGTGTPGPSETPGIPEIAGSKDPVTFTIFSRNADTAPADSNKIYKKVAELTGVKLQYEFLVGELKQRIGLMLSSKEYPDLVFVGGDAPDMLTSGAAIDVTDYIKKAPNLNYLYNEHNPLWGKRNVFKDGKTYVMEVYGTHFGPPSQKTHNHTSFWLQKEVLSSAGFPAMPKDLASYFGLIKDYYTKNPKIDGVDTIPFDFSLLRGYGGEVQNWAGYATDGHNMLWDQSDITKNEGISVYSDYNKQFLKEMNKYYRDGLIAKDSFTQTLDSYKARMASGAMLATFNPHWYFGSAVTSLKTEKKDNRTYVPCSLLVSPDRVDNYFDPRDVTGNNGTFISVKCKDPQRVINFLDWLVTEEVQKLLSWGIEGDDYTVDKDGLYTRSAEMDTNWRNAEWTRNNTGSQMKNILPKREGWFSDGNACSWTEQDSVYTATLRDYDKQFLEAYKVTNFHQLIRIKDIKRAAYYPSWGSIIFTAGSPEALAETKISELSKEYVPQIVVAKDDAAFEAKFTEYWNKLTEAKPETILNVLKTEVPKTEAALTGK